MADTIGRGIIEVVADASQLEAGMQKAGAAVEKFERAAVDAAARAGKALAGAGDGASVATDKLDNATKRYVASVEREIAATTKSRAEFRAWQGQVQNISESVYGPLVARLSAAKDAQDAFARSTNEQAVAQRAAAQAAKELAAAQQAAQQKQASQSAFLDDLREQRALYFKATDAAQQYKAARLGIAAEAAPLVAGLREAKAAQDALVLSARAEAQAQKEASAARRSDGPVSTGQSQIDTTRTGLLSSLAQTRTQLQELANAESIAAGQASPLIAKLRETAQALDAVAIAEQRVAQADRDAAQAAVQAKAARDSVIARVTQRVEAVNLKTPEDALEAEAAKVGATAETEKLIAVLRRQRVEEEQLAKATRDQAQAERDATQAKAARDSFVGRVKERFDDRFGLKTQEDLLSLQAAELGVVSQTSVMIAGLREAKVAQEALAQAAKAEAQAQRDATQARSTRGPTEPLQGSDTARTALLASLNQTREQLKALGNAEAGAASQAGPLIAKLQETTRALDEVAFAEQRVSAQKNFLAGLQTRVSSIGKMPSDLAEIQAAQMGVTASAAPMIAMMRASEKSVGNLGLSAKQTTAAMRLLPAQITDIVTSLASGQQPWLVAIQQGGQIKDSFGGIGPAFQVLTKLITPMVIGMTAAAGAVGLLAFGFLKGQQESDEFNKSLILTGNAASTTVSGLTDMASAVGQVVGTQGAAAEALAELAASGRVGSGNLQQFAETAVRMERVTGQAVKATVAQFVELGRSPVEASRKLNEQHHYLTGTVYAQIVALVEQGRATEAARLAQETWASASNSRLAQVADSLGFVQKRWIDLKDIINGVADAVLRIGRPDTTGEEIKLLQGRIDQTEANRNKSLSSEVADRHIAEYRKRLDLLNGIEKATLDVAKADGARAAATEASVKAQGEIMAGTKQYATDVQKLETALAAYRKQLDAVRNDPKLFEPSSGGEKLRAMIDPQAIARQEAAMRESILKKPKKGEKPRDATESLLKFDIDKIKNALEQVTGAYKNAESILEAVRSAGLMSEKDYYSAKVSFIRLGTDASIKALEEENAAIEKQQALLEAKRPKLKGNDLVDNQKQTIEHNKQIADNEAKMAVARASATSQIEVLGIRQKKAFDDATDAAARLYAQMQALSSGSTAADDLLTIAKQVKQARETLRDAGTDDAKGGQIAERFGQLLEQQRQVNKAREDFSLITQRASNAEERLRLAAEDSGDGIIETDRAIYAVRANGLTQMEAINTKVQELARLSGDPKLTLWAEDIANSLERARQAADPALARLRAFQKEVAGTLSSSVSDAFANFPSERRRLAAELARIEIEAAPARQNLKSTDESIRTHAAEKMAELEAKAAKAREEHGQQLRKLFESIEKDLLRMGNKIFLQEPLEQAMRKAMRGATEGGGLFGNFFKDVFGVFQTNTQGPKGHADTGFVGGEGIGGLLKKGFNALFGGAPSVKDGQTGAQEAFRSTELAAQNAAGSLLDMTSATSIVSSVMGALPATAAIPATTALGTLALAANAAARALASVAGSSGAKTGEDVLGSFIGMLGGGGGGFGTGAEFGNMDFGGFFAAGGRPPVGKPSIVGEKGREWFVPDSAGTIVPQTAMPKQTGSKTYHINVNVPQGTSRENSNHIAATIVRRLKVADMREN